jgi:hypothetical protein
MVSRSAEKRRSFAIKTGSHSLEALFSYSNTLTLRRLLTFKSLRTLLKLRVQKLTKSYKEKRLGKIFNKKDSLKSNRK